MRLSGLFVRFGRASGLPAAALCAALYAQAPAQAQFAGTPSAAEATVAEAMTARVGSYVSLTGSLKKEIGRAQYLFRDGSGDIRVRIEREFWQGRKVTGDTVLQLRGRVETDVRGRFVDVYYFRIVE